MPNPFWIAVVRCPLFVLFLEGTFCNTALRLALMKAIGILQSHPTTDPHCFETFEVEIPQPQGRELLVRVRAIAVNPVDAKVRSSIQAPLEIPRILGWDAAGTVSAVGPDVQGFQVGDEVFYAGSLTRPGCNAEFQLVDERIVGRKPQALTFEQAAALPLTSITAWEALFERMGIVPEKTAGNGDRWLLIINGAGGVGSIAIQLAKQVAGLNVIATASRPETIAWCKRQGADEVLNHREPLAEQLRKLRLPLTDSIFCCHDTDPHWQNMADCIKPLGRVCALASAQAPLDLNVFKNKSVAFCWEFMFTKAMYETEMETQGKLLNRVADLCNSNQIRTTLQENLGPLNATNLARAHAKLEAGRTIGKIVLSGF